MKSTLLILLTLLPAAGAPPVCPPNQPCVLQMRGDDLQSTLDALPPHSTLLANRQHEIVVGKTIRITKPVTITGLNARLREALPRIPLIEVFSPNVTFQNFHLTGNIATVKYEDRAALLVFRRGHFLVENGEFIDSAKDGITVTPLEGQGDIEHGVIRNIIGRNNARDTVSIAGLGEHGLFVRHILVENVRCYNSRDRGVAEASDGSESITFRDIYSESSFYGIDVQDHNRAGQTNRHIVIDNLRVRDCVTAIRTANHDFGHRGLQIRNVTGEAFRPDKAAKWMPLDIRNTRDVHLENIRLTGIPAAAAMQFVNVEGLTARDLTFAQLNGAQAAIKAETTDAIFFDNVILDAAVPPKTAIHIRLAAGKPHQSIRIHNSLLAAAPTAIFIENESKAAKLKLLEIRNTTGTNRIEIEPQMRRVDHPSPPNP